MYCRSFLQIKLLKNISKFINFGLKEGHFDKKLIFINFKSTLKHDLKILMCFLDTYKITFPPK